MASHSTKYARSLGIKILRNDEKSVIEYLMAFLLATVDQGEMFLRS